MLASRLTQRRLIGKKRINYKPNKGFIGKYEVDVANYIFTSKATGYSHSQELVDVLLNSGVENSYNTSQRLTRFLKKRDLTFQKSDKDGVYRIFTVPVTTSVVPLQKSVFDSIEVAAQGLIVALRKVLQDLYGSPSIQQSRFVNALPEKIKQTFLDATLNSPHYIPQLHHANMKDYPFFDNVGLDLVLVDQYLQKRGVLSRLLEQGRVDELPELPFRILELNAGSPSGASNNANILEGILREDPSILDALGKVLPNDHFKVLRETYQSLGESWTARADGVQVIIPPGGANGASPEIHQLAAYSGLIYCDPGQLYQDQTGWVRMRTVTGSDPIVTAIYSRVNTDSALFDKEKGILLRDPETGENLYRVDTLKPAKKGKPEEIKDQDGNPIALQSDYAIPGAVDAIINRRLYMGGLNRLLDNKIILATLTEFAPVFFKNELEARGLSLDTPKIIPPECLPSSAASLEKICKNPKDWVIKAPNLSGGSGVHILMTLDDRKRREVISEAKKNPEQYAYQRVVKIGRIPVAVRGSSGFRFANLAADVRMWVFYGGEGTLPRLTHNALVRYAPKEKGPMSSIVNTSKGGGYAPFVVVDDIGSPDAITARELAAPREPVPYQSALPTFASAQLVQVANILNELRQEVRNPQMDLYRVSGFLYSIKLQVREIASFIHPRCMETIYSMIELVEKRLDSKTVAAYYLKMNTLHARLVSLLQDLKQVLNPDFFLVMDELNVVNQDLVNRGYTYEMKRMDLFNFGHLSFILRKATESQPMLRRDFNRLRSLIKEMITLKNPTQTGNILIQQRLETLIDQFCDLAAKRLRNSIHAVDFAALFDGREPQSQLNYQETFVIPHVGKIPRSGTEWEMINQQTLANSPFIDPVIQEARQAWLKVLSEAEYMPRARRDIFLQQSRITHFEQYPQLKEIQKIINRRENADFNSIVQLMNVMPYAAYNLRQYAIEQGISFEKLFSDQLAPEKISILSRASRKREKLSLDAYSGECFAKKRYKHGLISEGDRYLWVAQEQSPLIQLYTIGHELIHAAQIKEILDMERRARMDGALAFSRFLNYYGNFLSLAANTLESHQTDQAQLRIPVFGLADRIVSQFYAPVIQDLRRGMLKGDSAYHQQLNKYGSLFGYMMPVSNAVRVKALREVVPALENAKNIIFAKECGLIIQLDEVRSALPIANRFQLDRYRGLITESAKQWSLNWEALRIIASHQYYGVMFWRAEKAEDNLTIASDPAPIFLNTAYNQTQQ